MRQTIRSKYIGNLSEMRFSIVDASIKMYLLEVLHNLHVSRVLVTAAVCLLVARTSRVSDQAIVRSLGQAQLAYHFLLFADGAQASRAKPFLKFPYAPLSSKCILQHNTMFGLNQRCDV